jgi:protein involved in temperature-dependent protein secretion
LPNETETPTPTEPNAGEMTAERALAWIDDSLEELGHALDACAESGADEMLVSAKINGFVLQLMSRQPDLAARAAAAGIGGGQEAA